MRDLLDGMGSSPLFRSSFPTEISGPLIGYCYHDEVEAFRSEFLRTYGRPLTGVVCVGDEGPGEIEGRLPEKSLPVAGRVIVYGRRARSKGIRLGRFGLEYFDFFQAPVGGSWLHDPLYVERYGRALLKLRDRLADEESRRTLFSILRFRVSNEAGFLRMAAYREYEHPLVRAEAGDVIVDGGMGDGFTAIRFAKACGPAGRVHGFEPDAGSRSELEKNISEWGLSDRIEISGEALWKGRTELPFVAGEGACSRIAFREERGNTKVATVDLDSFAERMKRCDLIKLDVEGAETQALWGARRTIRRFRPRLQISVYHRSLDLFRIPALIDRIQPGARFYLGHHSPGPVETDLYVLYP